MKFFEQLTKQSLIIILGSIIGLFIIFLIILVLLLKSKKNRRERTKTQTVQILPIKKMKKVSSRVEFGAATHIGSREYQQDAYYIPNNDNKLKSSDAFIGIMCDGMGGMECGEKASQLCVKILSEAFKDLDKSSSFPEFYYTKIQEMDDEVIKIRNSNGEQVDSGTTLTSIIVKEDNLYWASVGDSRIYIFRNGELVQMVRAHNYEMELIQKVKSGLLTENDMKKDPLKHALISYIGIGSIEIMDISQKPFKLMKDDIILLCSDGVYDTISNDEIVEILSGAVLDIQKMMNQIIIYTLNKKRPNQDNLTVVGLKYLG